MSPRCPPVRRVQVQLSEIVRELAETPPLTACATSRLWTAVGSDATGSRPWRGVACAAGLAAAAMVVGRVRTEVLGTPLGDGEPRRLP